MMLTELLSTLTILSLRVFRSREVEVRLLIWAVLGDAGAVTADVDVAVVGIVVEAVTELGHRCGAWPPSVTPDTRGAHKNWARFPAAEQIDLQMCAQRVHGVVSTLLGGLLISGPKSLKFLWCRLQDLL
jgi:hypothetical protein